ncbi:unnamed protein product [Anisakis simplex]|uniref:Uncharacterized protein n=1 Tax=Anisakis simplex TaxID=6269 RepID=A0A3P6PGR2_ANISI|nr:unnamed protein product [Anisakis simplex]
MCYEELECGHIQQQQQHPPSYPNALMRIRQNDHERFSRHNVPPRVFRQYNNRSSSLPRGLHHNSDYEDGTRRDSIDYFDRRTHQKAPQPQQQQQQFQQHQQQFDYKVFIFHIFWS